MKKNIYIVDVDEANDGIMIYPDSSDEVFKFWKKCNFTKRKLNNAIKQLTEKYCGNVRFIFKTHINNYVKSISCK